MHPLEMVSKGVTNKHDEFAWGEMLQGLEQLLSPQQPCDKLYMGNLGSSASKGELERVFSYYGPLCKVHIARNPLDFAFVEFENPRDATDVELGLDRKIPCAPRIRAEL